MVSNLFIDEYMKSANDAQIKVYLYLLRMMSAHRTTSVSDLADLFNHTEKDVVRSLRYWEQRGLLDLTFGSGDDLVSICLRKPRAVSRTGRREEEASFVCAKTGTEGAAAASSFSVSPGADATPPAASAAGASPLKESCGGSFFEGSRSESGRSAADSESGPDSRAGHVLAFPGGAAAPGTEHRQGARPSLADGSAHKGACTSAVSRSSGKSAGGAAKKEDSGAEMKAVECFREDKNRAQLLFAIEQYIGKPLSLNEVRIIWHISEGLHFSDDLIDYLLQFCVDRGKKDFRYISKVAESWAQKGITTPAQAEASSEEISAKARALAGRQRKSFAHSGREESAAQGTDSPGEKEAAGRSGKGPSAGRRPKSANSFNQFEQNSYDFDALENELLGVAGN